MGVVAYTKSLMWPMVAFTTAINCVFVPLIIAGLCFTAGGVEEAFLLNLIFYIIFTPIISVTLMKVMFMSENNMIVKDALRRNRRYPGDQTAARTVCSQTAAGH